MCGIVGVIGTREFSVEKLLQRIGHRGPDSSGHFDGGEIFLGHTRLSIQDLSTNGAQPMWSADGRYVIVFNGEIYNHLDLRAELGDIEFKSTSDTETLLYAYIKYGQEFLNKLNGIFALAIYDLQDRELFLARDQFGVKPLYFYDQNGKFYFSSEIKSFLELPMDRSVSVKALSNYLSFLWAPGEMTPFAHVKKLLPGHFIKFNLSEAVIVRPERYYKLPFNGRYLDLGEDELVKLLEEKLLSAVKRQMLSDVPVGFFLSGGLDSSLLVAMARKLYPTRKLSCFTIDSAQIDNEGFVDDLPYAKKVAQHLDVELNIINADVDIFSDLDKMIWHLDEPQADPAPLNVYNICKYARQQGIKVLIGGAGADDLFSGYRRHQALRLESYFRLVPKPFAKALISVLNCFSSNGSTARRARKLVADIDKDSIKRMAGYFRWLPFNDLLALFKPEVAIKIRNDDPIKYLEHLLKEIPDDKSALNQMLYMELNTFLVDHNLNYTDKMSMAAGVETRVPYLDIDLVEFSTKIPPKFKMKGYETKYLLKKVAEKYLPKDVIYRPKTGFGAPVRNWVLDELRPLIANRLSNDKLDQRGLLDSKAVWKLIEDNRSGKIDASYIVLSLLAMESWMKQFLDRRHVDNHLNL